MSAQPATVRAGRSATLLTFEEMDYVTETATGLAFSLDTPLELWGALTERLVRAHKRIEWCIADCINFGEVRYGDDLYTQWIEETGLSKRTLQNIARIGRLVEPARRRAEVSFSHHEAVAKLPPSEQERMLDRAESEGMTRYDLRDAVRVRLAEIAGEAVTASGEPIPSVALAWAPDLADLVPEARAALEARAPRGAARAAFVAGALWALVYAHQEDLFLPGRWRL